MIMHTIAELCAFTTVNDIVIIGTLFFVYTQHFMYAIVHAHMDATVYLVYFMCTFIYMYLYLVIPLFRYLSFVHLLDRIWDPGFACPDLDPVASPSEKDQAYLEGLVEQQ